MRKTLFTMSAAVAVCGLLSSPAAAQYGDDESRPGTSGTQTPATPSTQERTDESKSTPRSDRSFIQKAADDSVAEVKLGELASEKASNTQVKQFAQRMVRDHGKAKDQLQPIASAQQVRIEENLEPEHQRVHDRLSNLSGEAFDRAYMDYMVEDHQKAVKLFQQHSQSASDPQVKQFASSQLPILQEHLREAQRLQREVGGARGTTGTTGGEQDRDRDRDQDRDRERTPMGQDDDEPSGVSDQPDPDREAPAPRQ